MSNEKLVKRYRFLRIWQIAENEAWFAEMSKQGFHLHSLGSLFAAFRPGEPAEYIYSIEPLSEEANNEERLTLYADAGWEFVTQMEQLQVFRAPAQANVKQIHTDRSLYLELLQERKKALFKSTLNGLIFGISYTAFALYRFTILATFLGVFFFVPYFFFFPNLFNLLLDYYYLHHYIKNQHLQKQIKTDYQQAVRKRKLMQGAVCLTGLLCLVFIIQIACQAKIKKPLALAPEYLLTLEEIYGKENIVVTAENRAGNKYTTAKSLRFTWTDYADHAAKTKNDSYVVIYGNVYIGRNMRTARQMVWAVVQHWNKWPRHYNIREYTQQPENPGFDELYLSDNYLTGMGVIVARQGNYVYDISFISDGQLVLDALYRQVTQLQ
jgi:hypothetical protein